VAADLDRWKALLAGREEVGGQSIWSGTAGLSA
jgi:hypothetical protein